MLLEVTIDNYDKTITLNMVDSLISHAANNASFSVLQSLKQGLERVNSYIAYIDTTKAKMMFIIYQRLLIVHTK